MATATHADASSSSGMSIARDEVSDWVERAARVGYAAKGVVYAVVGVLAVKQAFGSGDVEGTRGALREMASGAFGQTLMWIMAVGLAGYVIWRLVQAFLDPEADALEEGGAKRAFKRLFFFGSAVVYGFLAWYAAQLAMTGGGGGAGGGGGGSGGSGSQGMVADLMGMEWGVWLMAAVGAGIVIRGLWQFWKAYTDKFKEKISSFDLGPGKSKWVVRASRLGLTARGVVFALIGGSILLAAVQRDPQEARGLEGSLEFLVTNPWLLGAVGVGLVGYAVYQWVKARYRLIGV